MSNTHSVGRRTGAPGSAARDILTEDAFHRMLQLEQNRSRRTQRPFALLMLETGRSVRAGNDFDLLPTILAVVHSITRESDLTGWMETGACVGVMLTEVQPENGLDALQARIASALEQCLSRDQFNGIRLRCAILPEDLASSPAVIAGDGDVTARRWQRSDGVQKAFSKEGEL